MTSKRGKDKCCQRCEQTGNFMWLIKMLKAAALENSQRVPQDVTDRSVTHDAMASLLCVNSRKWTGSNEMCVWMGREL